MTLLSIECAPSAVAAVRAARPFSPEEIARLRDMALDYECQIAKKPFDNHCMIAFSVCARAVALPPGVIRAKDRNFIMSELRQQMMAFARIISQHTPNPDAPILNSWCGIGRAFNRTHGAVMAATRKYGDAIDAVLAAEF